jgi:class 3 adenylate cyclase
MPENRKLAAILAADVVGFSRLAGADEDRTLARLRALRSDLIDPTIAVHHGRVVKRTGDGILIEFRSVVDAVRCAMEMQNGMVERNAGLPAERRIEFRVGIHLGDVVEESDGDLMGDGVNIAARLEGVAKPGAICLSEDAYRQVRARLDLARAEHRTTCGRTCRILRTRCRPWIRRIRRRMSSATGAANRACMRIGRCVVSGRPEGAARCSSTSAIDEASDCDQRSRHREVGFFTSTASKRRAMSFLRRQLKTPLRAQRGQAGADARPQRAARQSMLTT